jgi:hypothetical protein
MTNEKNPNQDPSVQPYKPVEFNPNDTEFAQENPAVANPLAQQLQAQNEEDSEFASEMETGAPMETKDARGGNHNPEGASGYTSGRVDDRGRKSKQDKYETKGADPRQADENRTHPNSNVGYTDDQRTGGNQ